MIKIYKGYEIEQACPVLRKYRSIILKEHIKHENLIDASHTY